jgi:hypothetical protein
MADKLGVLTALSGFTEGLAEGFMQRQELEARRDAELAKLEDRRLQREFEGMKFMAEQEADARKEERLGKLTDATVQLKRAQARKAERDKGQDKTGKELSDLANEYGKIQRGEQKAREAYNMLKTRRVKLLRGRKIEELPERQQEEIKLLDEQLIDLEGKLKTSKRLKNVLDHRLDKRYSDLGLDREEIDPNAPTEDLEVAEIDPEVRIQRLLDNGSSLDEVKEAVVSDQSISEENKQRMLNFIEEKELAEAGPGFWDGISNFIQDLGDGLDASDIEDIGGSLK